MTTSVAPTSSTITSPRVVNVATSPPTIVAGDIVDAINPTVSLADGSSNAIRCAAYFGLGLLVAKW